MRESLKLEGHFSEFLSLLVAHRVRFVIVGAHALAALGAPRFTGDLDLLVEPSATNARRVAAALTAFGFVLPPQTASELARRNRMLHLGREPNRIDLLTSIDGVSFARAFRNRTRVRLGDQVVGILARAEYIDTKRAAGRPKDVADLALLAEAEGPARRRR